MIRMDCIRVSKLALSALVLLTGEGCQYREQVYKGGMTGQPVSQSAPTENATITYNFPAIPFGQFLAVYEAVAGQKVAWDKTPMPRGVMHVITARPLTKTDAMRLCEDEMKVQMGLIIVHGKDGSLAAIVPPQYERL